MRRMFKKHFIRLISVKNSIFGSMDYKKFVVITHSRTGSNLLISLLNDHPCIEAYGEIFRRLNKSSCKKIWHNTFNKKSKSIEYAGFKLFYYHPLDRDDLEVWSFIERDTSIKIIYLRRQNMLRSFVSRKIAEKTNSWRLKNSDSGLKVADKKVDLSFEECLEEFEQIRLWQDRTMQTYRFHESIQLTYEELVNHRDDVLNRVFEFLNVPVVPVKSKYKKQNQENLSDLIANYDEIYNSLSQTKWNSFLK